MKILHVIPIAKGISMEVLTYFTTDNIVPGTLVSIPLRKKEIPALVVRSEDASGMRQNIRSLSFNLKKVSGPGVPDFLLPEFLATAEKCAEYFVGTTGSALQKLIPQSILSETPDANELEKKLQRKKNPAIESKSVPKKSVIAASEEKRFSQYETVVKESFGKNLSVFCVAPTIADAENLFKKLAPSFKNSSFLFTSQQTKKKQIQNWNESLNSEQPVFVVATPSFLALPRPDFGTFIIEKESSRAYKGIARPFLDHRFCTERLAEEMKANLVLGDEVLQTETFYRVQNKELAQLAEAQNPLVFSSAVELVDMKKDQTEKMQKDVFQIFSVPLKRKLELTKTKKEKVFLFCARRGYAPSVVCRDCGEVVLCEKCSRPVTLAGNAFHCRHCRLKRDAKEVCKACTGWRLTGLGIGTEQVAEKIHKALPSVPLFILDKESAKTHAQAKKIIRDFEEAEGGVLVGTEMALLYLDKVDTTAVVSIDSFLSLPDWKINEKIVHILISLRRKAKYTCILQTRMPEHPILKPAITGDIETYQRAELAERKQFGYPPFATFIRITCSAGQVTLPKAMKYLSDMLTKHKPLIFQTHALLRLPQDFWINTELQRILTSLPPAFSVQVDPEQML